MHIGGNVRVTLGYMGIMEENTETTIMGYIGFRVQFFFYNASCKKVVIALTFPYLGCTWSVVTALFEAMASICLFVHSNCRNQQLIGFSGPNIEKSPKASR